MKVVPTTLSACWVAASAVLLGTSHALPAATSEIAARKPNAPSAGLVNDWLREQSPAASDWDVGGQFRVRYESKINAGSFPNRDFLEGLDNSNDYFLFRTKVHLGWSPANWLTIFSQGRDAHSTGDERPISEEDAFDLHQAYVQLGDPHHFPLTLKVGRQELLYGDERYIGVADWSNFGRSFDAAKLRFEQGAFWLDAFSGRQVIPHDGHFNQSNDYDWFSGLYGSSRALVPWQDTELFFLARNVGTGSPTAVTPTLGGPGPRDIYTAGTRWKSVPEKLGPWDYVFEAVGQFGSINQGGTRLDHQAFAVNATGGYTLKKTFGSPRFHVGYDFATGDSDPADDHNETFEMLFGTNHRLYGVMDLFSMRNMHIPRLGASFKPAKDLTVSLDWLGFWMADTADFLYPEAGGGRNQNGYGRHPGFDSYVGNEIELQANWQVAPWGQVQAGYGHFFAGDYVRDSAASGGFDTEDADWIYLQVRFSF